MRRFRGTWHSRRFFLPDRKWPFRPEESRPQTGRGWLVAGCLVGRKAAFGFRTRGHLTCRSWRFGQATWDEFSEEPRRLRESFACGVTAAVGVAGFFTVARGRCVKAYDVV
jgi:hypothetical protein